MTGEFERLQLRHRHAKMGVCRGCREVWPCPTWLLLDDYKEAVEALSECIQILDYERDQLSNDDPIWTFDPAISAATDMPRAVLARAREQGVIE